MECVYVVVASCPSFEVHQLDFEIILFYVWLWLHLFAYCALDRWRDFIWSWLFACVKFPSHRLTLNQYLVHSMLSENWIPKLAKSGLSLKVKYSSPNQRKIALFCGDIWQIVFQKLKIFCICMRQDTRNLSIQGCYYLYGLNRFLEST